MKKTLFILLAFIGITVNAQWKEVEDNNPKDKYEKRVYVSGTNVGGTLYGGSMNLSHQGGGLQLYFYLGEEITLETNQIVVLDFIFDDDSVIGFDHVGTNSGTSGKSVFVWSGNNTNKRIQRDLIDRISNSRTVYVRFTVQHLVNNTVDRELGVIKYNTFNTGLPKSVIKEYKDTLDNPFENINPFNNN